MKIDKSEWKEMFKHDISEKMIESKREYELYKKTGRVVYLQQAGNKLFSVVENWLMVKYNKRVSSYQDLKNLTKDNRNDRLLLSKVAQLHYFFYENELRGEAWEFEEIYLESYKNMSNRIR